MQLSKLLDGVRVTKLYQTMFGRMVVTHDVEIRSVQYDSRRVGKNDCFVALRGTGTDGHRFLSDAVNKGAKAVVIEDESHFPDSLAMHTGIVKIVVADSRKALAQIAANYYHHPSRALTVVGVTGTNGKTTTTHVIKSILEAQRQRVGLIGTIEYRIGDESFPAHHTTPESLELNRLLALMVEAGCTSVSMEVSSHALHQSRVFGIDFNVAVFTNLTQDHLDYHGTMEQYFEAKKILFDGLKHDAVAVVNIDDAWGRKLAETCPAPVMTYGFEKSARVRATEVGLSITGTTLTFSHAGSEHTVASPLVGRFNVSNMLAACSVGLALGIPPDTIGHGIAAIPAIRGRFERIASPQGWTAIIDYAHTPDALEQCLRTIREVLPQGRIVTVFGAGGDRDHSKRPLMGGVAGRWSDLVVVTSDNPRTEDPDAIIDQVVKGVPAGTELIREVDRRAAIHRALSLARSGDAVLIAGKGHEEYQTLGTQKIHFSDREVVEEFVRP
jgi:UDP-N-acetylmuramoyl-L-alanyl-D-glutamate--2,6-diaminopimelate ligase